MTLSSLHTLPRSALVSGLVIALLVACSDGPSGPQTVQPASITASPTTGTLEAIGATLRFTATVRDQDGSPIPDAEVGWSSSSPAVATIASDGTVTAIAGGSATITATSGPVSTTVSLVVNQAVASVGVTPSVDTLKYGDVLSFSAVAFDGNGHAVVDAQVSWSSSATHVVAIDEQTGVATAGAAGTATISASAASATGTAEVTVLPRPVASVEISPAEGSIMEDETLQLNATARDVDGNVLTGRSVQWTSSAPSVATVSSTGLVTGVTTGGPATISATSEGQSGSAQITVSAPITSVTIHGQFRIKVGDAYTYTATARLEDGTVVNRPMTWSILETSKGTMTSDGRLTALDTGVITVLIEIDGSVWQGTVNAYDWRYLEGSGSQFLSLPSDTEITNKWGNSEYPELVFACNSNSGSFFAWVSTDSFVTAHGFVSYRFGSGSVIHEEWIEFSDFSSLGHPGPTNREVKSFAVSTASARTFSFAFTEFNGPAKATIFRVTGLGSLLQPLLDACPSNAIMTNLEASELQLAAAYQAAGILPEELRRAREARVQEGPQIWTSPGTLQVEQAIESQEAIRKR